MRILVFSERLAPPFDEGIKNVTVNLIRRLKTAHQVLALTTGGADVPALGLREVPGVNRLLLNGVLTALIRDFHPERIVYIPTASMTFFSFVRAWVLGRCAPWAEVSMVALQPRRQSRWMRRIVPVLAPERVVVPSRASAGRLDYLGKRVRLAPAGVDVARFQPLPPAQKAARRREYGLPERRALLLHVGHINRNRNVAILADLAALEGMDAILVGSTSTPQDASLTEELRAAGVHVITDYLADIEEVYQIADLYIFPAPPDRPDEKTPAIDMPLSVLEAMACDLPVVTTRFGSLPDYFPAGGGIWYVENPEDADEWREKVRAALSGGAAHTRERVSPFSWDHFVSAVIGEGGDD